MNQELLYKYFKGTTTIEEEKRILDWVEASEENREAFLKERMTDKVPEKRPSVWLRY